MLRLFVYTIAMATLLFVSGCSSSTEEAKVYPVTGKVTIDNAPLANATVMLQPIEGGSFGYGETDANGLFVISTFAVGDGAIPGEHRIVITKKTPAAELASSGDGSDITVDQSGSMTQSVPKRYGNAESSGLKVMVEADLEPLVLKLTGIE